MNHDDISRRGFLEAGTLATAAAGLIGPAEARANAPQIAALFLHTAPMDVVRIGFVGCGLQGTEHIKNLLAIEGVELRAVCDIAPEKVANAQQLAKAAGKARAA